MGGWLRDSLDDGSLEGFLAERDGCMEGYVFFQHRKRPETPLTFAREILLVDNLGVRPESRGTGVGRALMEACEARARALGYQRVQLYARWTNERARAFYEALGYGAVQVQFEKLL